MELLVATELATATQEAAEFEVVPDPGTDDSDPETEKVIIAFMTEHASEIAAEANKPFRPIGGIQEEVVSAETHAMAATAGATASPSKPATTVKMPSKKLTNAEDEQRGSVLQKIAKLDIKGRSHL